MQARGVIDKDGKVLIRMPSAPRDGDSIVVKGAKAGDAVPTEKG